MSDQKRYIENLPEEISRKLLLESFSEAIIIVNRKEEIIYANARMTEIFEYSVEELIGKSLSILIPETFKNLHHRQVETFFVQPQNRAMGIGMNLTGKKKNGTDFPVEISLSHLKAEINIYVMAFISDISIRHKIETELKERNNELKSFASMLSHDINSLLTGIVGFSDLLAEDDNFSPEKQKEFLQIISQYGRKAVTIIQEILLLSSVSKENISMSSVDFKKIINEAIKRNTELIEKRLATILVSENFENLISYGPWIEEVFYNLISNALKYGGNPPKIEIFCQRINLDCIKYIVKDNGPGISEENKKLILLEQDDIKMKIVKGHGIGLPMVDKIIRKLGGVLEIENCKDGGTQFCFTLPVQ
jgi:PAS domain S-box-containing protein